MPIKHAIWTVGENPAPLAIGRLASEKQLGNLKGHAGPLPLNSETDRLLNTMVNSTT
jgi:hypothetical protein